MLSLVRRQRRSWMVPRLVECSAASHQRVSNLLMGLRFANTSVIAVVAVALCQLPNAAQPQLDSITDPDAYAVYAAVIPQAWAHVSKEVLLLQQETEGLKDTCFSSIRTAGAEWGAIAIVYQQENARVRVLERLLPVDTPYRLVPHAEILADDKRLEYAAVSAVGFNAAKTKALVSVSFRNSGFIQFMEIREGKWVFAPVDGCNWIA